MMAVVLGVVALVGLAGCGSSTPLVETSETPVDALDAEFDGDDADEDDEGEEGDGDDADEDDEGEEGDGDDEGRQRGEAVVQSRSPSSGLGEESTWQPWEWNGYQKFPSLYFAAEPEGLLSDDQMAKVNRFELAIIEFRAGQFAEEESSGQWAGGDLAGFMDQQATVFREAHPDGPPMLTYRSGMWAGSMFADQWDALQNPSLFIPDSRLCDGFIGYPKDVDESGFTTDLQYCRWDFTNPDTQAEYQAMVADSIHLDTAGLFFDNAQSVVCDDTGELSRLSEAQRLELSKATEQLYRQAFSILVEAGKYPILSTTNSMSEIGPLVPWESACPAGEESMIAALDGLPFARNNEFWMWNLGELATNQVLNSIAETERGVPIIVHMPWFPNDQGCLEGCVLSDGTVKAFTQDEFLEFGMAAFLVTMGPGSYFGFSDMQSDVEGGGWFDVSWDYHSQFDSIITGVPLGPAQIGDDGATFTRVFENGTVEVNTVTGEYSIDLGTN